jgi:hypothetical protein
MSFIDTVSLLHFHRSKSLSPGPEKSLRTTFLTRSRRPTHINYHHSNTKHLQLAIDHPRTQKMCSTTDAPPPYTAQAEPSPRPPLSSLLYSPLSTAEASKTPLPASPAPSPPLSPRPPLPSLLYPPSPHTPSLNSLASPTSPISLNAQRDCPFPSPTTPHTPRFSSPLAIVSPRPAPAHRGNFLSRLFSRTPAHNADIELGTLPARLHQVPTITAEVERRKREEWIFCAKIGCVVCVIVGFWAVIAVKMYREHGGE